MILNTIRQDFYDEKSFYFNIFSHNATTSNATPYNVSELTICFNEINHLFSSDRILCLLLNK